jgi:hypothetical protein
MAAFNGAKDESLGRDGTSSRKSASPTTVRTRCQNVQAAKVSPQPHRCDKNDLGGIVSPSEKTRL